MSNCLGLPCGGYTQGTYDTNNYSYSSQNSNITSNCGHQQACAGCLDIIKTQCIRYPGVNLPNTGINMNDDLTVILQKLDDIKRIQELKNVKMLANVNDINTRLNVLTGVTHIPYTAL